jgi:Fe-S metabolism associated domain
MFSNSDARFEPLSEAAHNDANKVRSCVSQVWLELGDGANAIGERLLHYRGDSDSHLVRALSATLPTLGYICWSYLRHGHNGCRLIARGADT